jgi:beta-N-acetylhexosaminidase
MKPRGLGWGSRCAAAGALALAALLLMGAKPAPAPKKPPLSAEERAAQRILNGLTLHDRIAQLVVVATNGDAYSRLSTDYRKYYRWVHEVHVGGIIVNNAVEFGLIRNAEPHAMAVFLNEMQRAAKVPLIVGSDFEQASSFRVRGGTRFPYAMAFGATGDPSTARYEGLIAAREARALGVHWIFAPVADVNNNPANPVINVRSFGEDPEKVSEFVTAFIEGAHSDPNAKVLVTAKHFPGHGDTDVDSHDGFPHISADRERLDQVELRPFQAAIEHGVDSIMTAHIAVPALDDSEVPSTVSPKVLTQLLRNELKFRNLIVTDAMTMAGLRSQFPNGEAAVRSIAAGADVLLMPPDPERAIAAVLTAVERGRIPKSRIDESALRVLAAKVRLGLMKKKLVDLDAISDVLVSDEANSRVERISERALTLVRNEGGVLPLARGSNACLVETMQVRASQIGLKLAQEFQRRAAPEQAPIHRPLVVDASLPLAAMEAALPDTSGCTAVVVVSSVTSAVNNEKVDLPGELGDFVRKLCEGPAPVLFVSLGSPYLLEAFPNVKVFLAAFGSTPASETAVVKALFGEIPVTGRLPVTIPGFAQLGDGIQLASGRK